MRRALVQSHAVSTNAKATRWGGFLYCRKQQVGRNCARRCSVDYGTKRVLMWRATSWQGEPWLRVFLSKSFIHKSTGRMYVVLRQHRTIRGCRLNHATVCIFSVILHQNSLAKVHFACVFLVCLTKNLTAHLRNQNGAVLP